MTIRALISRPTTTAAACAAAALATLAPVAAAQNPATTATPPPAPDVTMTPAPVAAAQNPATTTTAATTTGTTPVAPTAPSAGTQSADATTLAVRRDPRAPTATRAWTGRVLFPTVARTQPAPRARVVARVSPYGPYDRDPQSLLVRESKRVKGVTWYRVLLSKRPNGSTGWVQADALKVTATSMRLKVDLSDRTLTLVSRGRTIATWPVAVGTNVNPTPAGEFAVGEIVPQARPTGFYGPFIITITAHSDRLSDFDGGKGQVAIHGTSLPGLLGRAASHGCVRISNEAIRVIAKQVPRGAPVDIVP